MSDDSEAALPEGTPRKEGTALAGEGSTGSTGGSAWRGSSAGRTGNETTLLGTGGNQPSETIGDFEVLGKLGQGGMGAVYRARQISLDRQVALKILPSTLEADADFVSRFQREARVAANLNHANLVKVFSSGQADGSHFIAMELVEGETLGDLIRRGSLPPLEALRICGEAARALEHGWQRAQLIHRDIKPGNIFLSQRGEVKVGDLGLAKSISGDTTGLTQTGTAMGTPHYISPEQARGDKDLDFRTDIYSLGCTLYQMLTGQTPYTGGDPVVVLNKHINAPVPAILKVLPSCPIPLARLVGKMLKKSKHERHGSYGELLAQIESVQALFAPATRALDSTLPPDSDATLLATPHSATPAAVRSATAAPAPAPKSKLPFYCGIAALVLALVLGGVFFLLPREVKLTKAQLYAKQRAAEQAAATPPRISAASTTKGPAAAESWQDAWKDPIFQEKNDDAFTLGPDGFLPRRSSIWRLRAGPRTDGALRLVTTFEGPLTPRLVARTVSGGDQLYQAGLEPDGKSVIISRKDQDTYTTIARAPLDPPIRLGAEIELEFRLAGSTLTLNLAGHPPLRATDATLPSGEFGLWTRAGQKTAIRTLQYLTNVPAEPWQDVLRDPGALELWGKFQRSANGLQAANYGGVKIVGRSAQRDGAVRLRTVMGEIHPQLVVRSDDLKGGNYHILIQGPGRPLEFRRWDAAKRIHVGLRGFPLPRPLLAGQEFEMELRVVGRTLTARVDGQLVGTLDSDTLAQGSFGLSGSGLEGATAPVKALYFLDLDSPAGASVASAPSVEPWQDVLADRSRFPGVRTVRNGNYETMSGHIQLAPPTARNGAMRARFILGKAGSAKLLRGVGDGNAGLYETVLAPDGQAAALYHRQGGASAQLGFWKLEQPRSLTDPRELEVRCVAGIFTIKVDGNAIASVPVPDLPPGVFKFQADFTAQILAVEYLDLDGKGDTLSPASPAAIAGSQAARLTATVSGRTPDFLTATKDAPFVNSLGMKFVPVPITGGPTGGKRVLFSIWETRVQDYEVFAADKRTEWKPLSNQGPSHPAVGVSQEDAIAYCTWLTEREQRSGGLEAGQSYRLASDHEWSCAVGIGQREDAAQPIPGKDQKINGAYPWGESWPPPPSAGNYSGDEVANQAPATLGLSLSGYRDPFPNSGQVGSFAPNPLGLFDLGGNAWEWCRDAVQREGILAGVSRGASLADRAEGAIRSSKRGFRVSDFRASNLGFRVVLVPVP